MLFIVITDLISIFANILIQIVMGELNLPDDVNEALDILSKYPEYCSWQGAGCKHLTDAGLDVFNKHFNTKAQFICRDIYRTWKVILRHLLDLD
jgi:hypothetical protein